MSVYKTTKISLQPETAYTVTIQMWPRPRIARAWPKPETTWLGLKLKITRSKSESETAG